MRRRVYRGGVCHAGLNLREPVITGRSVPAAGGLCSTGHPSSVPGLASITLVSQTGMSRSLEATVGLVDLPSALMSDHTELSEVKSSVYPSLERVPGKQNWVDHAKGLPSYIERIAKHLHYEKGMDIGHSIATAVNVVKRWSTAGNVTKHGAHQVTAKTRAKAAKAVAEWEKKKKSGSHAMAAARHAARQVAEADTVLEAELLGVAGSEPFDLLEDVAANLTRYHGHAVGLARQMAHNTLHNSDGVRMSPDEREQIAGQLSDRLALLEGVALSLTGERTRARSFAVAMGQQFLGDGNGSVQFANVPDADDVIVRGLLAQLQPELLGLDEAISALNGNYELLEGECETCGDKSKKKSKTVVKDEYEENADDREEEQSGTDDDDSEDRTTRTTHLQRRLNSLGFDKLKEDGRFGPKTDAVVRQFQKAVDLNDDGVVGPKTTTALRQAPSPEQMAATLGVAAPPATIKPDEKNDDWPVSPSEDSAPTTTAARKSKTDSTLFKGIGVGDRKSNDGVKEMQGHLSRVGYKVEEDGRFGPQTEQTVKRFQRKYGLNPDGIVGPKTKRTLKGVVKRLDEIEEAAMERSLAEDAATWAEFRDLEAELRRGLIEAEARGETVWPELDDEFDLDEAAKKCDCWDGYERVPGTKPCGKKSCRRKRKHLTKEK